MKHGKRKVSEWVNGSKAMSEVLMERGQLCPRELMGKADVQDISGRMAGWAPPTAVDFRAQDSLTWTRGQSCPRSNNAVPTL